MNIKSLSAFSTLFLLIPLVTQAGDPIPGIEIVVEQSPGGVVSTGATNSAGEFTVNNLAAGEYQITLSGNGHSIVVGQSQTDRISISNTRMAVKPIRLELSRYQDGNDIILRKRPGRTTVNEESESDTAGRATDYNSSRSNRTTANATHLDDDSDGDGIPTVRAAGGNIAQGTTERRRVEVLKSNKQGDPDANKYDFANNDMDQDCTGGMSRENCGDGTSPVGGDCEPGSARCEALDPDSDNDTVLDQDRLMATAPASSTGERATEVAPIGVDDDCSGIAEIITNGTTLTVVLTCDDKG